MTTPLHVTVLIDRSGSMSPLREQVVEGVNQLFADQRDAIASGGDASDAPAALRITVAQFDSRAPFEINVDAMPIADVADLTTDDFTPRGDKPLLDAIGRLVQHLDGRPDDEDQLIAIVTDGQENASTDYTITAIRNLIEERTEAGWTFLFLDANQDSFRAVSDYGMRRSQRRKASASPRGTARVFNELNSSVAAHRNRSRSDPGNEDPLD